ncbi:MAG: efflux RND transporter periplasmic adaptor subunit [Acidobacteria bacterium]|nr:efflux RND transporter periplasmic adaptor subunit [Acidobacteriota bacterium]
MKPILPSLLGLVVLSAGCGSGTPAAPAASTSGPIATVRVQAADLPSTFEAGGIVRARTTAVIASRLLAPVVAVHVRPGDRVRRGAPLVTLEGREMAAAHARARAVLSASEETVRAAEGSVQAADAAVTLARTTHDRMRTLFEKRSATAHELDQATAALDGAQAQMASARANLAAAVASRAAADAAVEQAASAQTYTSLTAPFDGVITDRAVDPGDMAAPGLRLLTLEDAEAVRLELTLDEARAALVSTSRPSRVSVRVEQQVRDGRDEPWIEAVVAEIARVDPASHSFVVKLDLPATVRPLSGTFGRARFEGPPRKALVVPASAVVRRGQLTFAYVVDDDDRVRLQPISPGARVDDRLEVLAGLSEGLRVVAQPPASLSEGVQIREGGR